MALPARFRKRTDLKCRAPAFNMIDLYVNEYTEVKSFTSPYAGKINILGDSFPTQMYFTRDGDMKLDIYRLGVILTAVKKHDHWYLTSTYRDCRYYLRIYVENRDTFKRKYYGYVNFENKYMESEFRSVYETVINERKQKRHEIISKALNKDTESELDCDYSYKKNPDEVDEKTKKEDESINDDGYKRITLW